MSLWNTVSTCLQDQIFARPHGRPYGAMRRSPQRTQMKVPFKKVNGECSSKLCSSRTHQQNYIWYISVVQPNRSFQSTGARHSNNIGLPKISPSSGHLSRNIVENSSGSQSQILISGSKSSIGVADSTISSDMPIAVRHVRIIAAEQHPPHWNKCSHRYQTTLPLLLRLFRLRWQENKETLRHGLWQYIVQSGIRSREQSRLVAWAKWRGVTALRDAFLPRLGGTFRRFLTFLKLLEPILQQNCGWRVFWATAKIESTKTEGIHVIFKNNLPGWSFLSLSEFLSEILFLNFIWLQLVFIVHIIELLKQGFRLNQIFFWIGFFRWSIRGGSVESGDAANGYACVLECFCPCFSSRRIRSRPLQDNLIRKVQSNGK